jgi:diacylglycerol kinase family enzyme
MGGAGGGNGGGKNIVVVTAGGDGTFMCLAQDAIDEGIVLNDGSISWCTLPFGTGNDLSQVLGWGKQPKAVWTTSIPTLALQILNAQEENFNVWQI